MKLIGLRGQSGVGKDYILDTILRPRGYLPWGISFPIKAEVGTDLLIAGVAQTPAEAPDMVFRTKPEAVRLALQEGRPTRDREEHGSGVHRRLCAAYLGMLKAAHPEVRIAVPDVRTLEDVEWLNAMRGVLLNVSAPQRIGATGLQTRPTATHFTEQGAGMHYGGGVPINNDPNPPIPLLDQVTEGIARHLGHDAITPTTTPPPQRPGGRMHQLAWEIASATTDQTSPRAIAMEAAVRFSRTDDGIQNDCVVIGQRRGGSTAWGEAYARVWDAAWRHLWDGTLSAPPRTAQAPRGALR